MNNDKLKLEKLVIKISKEEKDLISHFANAKSINVSALVRRLLIEHIKGEMGYVESKDS